jgi:DNA-nicking Smr family endonuclease
VRRLSSEEQAIWAKLARSVTPLAGRAAPPEVVERRAALSAPAKAVLVAAAAMPAKVPPPQRMPQPVLDSSWERRIGNGTLAPDAVIDLHNHSLDAAHQRLNHALAQAVAKGQRVLLVVTGNPRPAQSGPIGHKGRGAIRAEIGDWLALSGQSDQIASVRTAHPRHGGKGALYVILRRRG